LAQNLPAKIKIKQGCINLILAVFVNFEMLSVEGLIIAAIKLNLFWNFSQSA